MTGFTFPGMMELPGWTSGRAISPMPARGPDPSHRRSLQIFIRLTATVLSAPDALTTESMVLWDWKWLVVSEKGMPVRSASLAMTRWANSGCMPMPVPTAVPPRGRMASSSRARWTRSRPNSIWPA